MYTRDCGKTRLAETVSDCHCHCSRVGSTAFCNAENHQTPAAQTALHGRSNGIWPQAGNEQLLVRHNSREYFCLSLLPDVAAVAVTAAFAYTNLLTQDLTVPHAHQLERLAALFPAAIADVAAVRLLNPLNQTDASSVCYCCNLTCAWSTATACLMPTAAHCIAIALQVNKDSTPAPPLSHAASHVVY